MQVLHYYRSATDVTAQGEQYIIWYRKTCLNLFGISQTERQSRGILRMSECELLKVELRNIFHPAF